MTRATYPAMILAVAALAACGRSEPKPAPPPDPGESALAAVINVGALALASDAITIRAPGHPEARIEAGGRLLVDGREVEVTDPQRAQLTTYHAAAMQLREHARDTGVAGARVGITAASAVLEGLLKGDPESIRPKVEAEAVKVKQAALRMCDDLATLRATEEKLAESLEAFRPYATVREIDVTGCRDGANNEDPPTQPADAPPATEVPAENAQAEWI